MEHFGSKLQGFGGVLEFRVQGLGLRDSWPLEGPDIRLSLSTLLLSSSSDVNFYLSIIKFQASKTNSVLILVLSA